MTSSALWVLLLALCMQLVTRWNATLLLLAAAQTVSQHDLGLCSGNCTNMLADPAPATLPALPLTHSPGLYLASPQRCLPACRTQLLASDQLCTRVMASPGIDKPMAALYNLILLAQ